MTESRHSLDDLPALMDERRKYESWLAALEARRETTPPHVFDRVKGDYLTRLQRVEEQLVAHRQAIEEERASSQSRLSILAADEQQRRDERAELELRSHVGELEGSAAETAFETIDSTLRRLVDEEKSVNERIAELNALLNFKSAEKTPPEPVVAQPPAAAPAPSAPAPAPASTNDGNKAGRNTPGGTFDELAFLSEVVGEKERRAAQSAHSDRVVPLPPAAAPAKPASSAGVGNVAAAHPVPAALAAAAQPAAHAAQATTSAPAAAPANVAPPAPPAPPALPPVQMPVIAAPPLASAPRAAAPVAAVATQSPEVENGADSREPLIPRRPSFMRKDDSEQSLLDGLEGAPRRGSRDAPLAANVSSNTPIVLKATGAVEQSKTLKCTECGAMNYPTEWYCERCGAELAAL